MNSVELWEIKCGGRGSEFPARVGVVSQSFDNTANTFPPCRVYQMIHRESEGAFILYSHDDVTILEDDWLPRILQPFSNPSCVAVGLGGAVSLGHPDLYKVPYKLEDMARGGYRSNQTDWQVHGEREVRECRVAVLDAFFMAVRREFVESVGGWPVGNLTHHCLDLWLACEAARHKKEIWMVGVECTHHGGGTSVKDVYRQAGWLQGGSLEEDHRRPHRWLYEEYRDVLPIRVGV